MSDEDEKLIEDVFLTKLGAKNPWVKAKGGVNEKYGVTGFPTILVLDANGVVVKKGMPSDAEIEVLLKDVSLAPKMPAEPRYAALRGFWERAEYAKVRDHLDKALADAKLDPAVRDLLTAQRDELQKRNERAVARAGELGKSTDYASAQDKLERLEKQWRGMPPSDAAKKELAKLASDPVAKKELAAEKALQKLVSQFDTSRVAQRRKLADELEKFAKKYDGTQAGKRAAEERTRLQSGG